jgi:hypothetical protein
MIDMILPIMILESRLSQDGRDKKAPYSRRRKNRPRNKKLVSNIFFFSENILFNTIVYIKVLGNPPILLGHLQLSLGQGIQQLVGSI